MSQCMGAFLYFAPMSESILSNCLVNTTWGPPDKLVTVTILEQNKHYVGVEENLRIPQRCFWGWSLSDLLTNLQDKLLVDRMRVTECIFVLV